ncbi:hypothetical protein ACFL2Y_05485, partial [Candidatus Omnitrophota bacterium]
MEILVHGSWLIDNRAGFLSAKSYELRAKHASAVGGCAFGTSSPVSKFSEKMRSEIERLHILGLFDEIGNLPGISIKSRKENVSGDCVKYVEGRLGNFIPAGLFFEEKSIEFIEVDLAEANIGDLVMYARKDPYLPTHFGIYLGGGMVESKFSVGHVYVHPIRYVSLSYGEPRILKKKQSASSSNSPGEKEDSSSPIRSESRGLILVTAYLMASSSPATKRDELFSVPGNRLTTVFAQRYGDDYKQVLDFL